MIEFPSADDARQACADVQVSGPSGVVYRARDDLSFASAPPEPDRLPAPYEAIVCWPFHDRPRVVPPAWGAASPPDSLDDPLRGRKVEEDALDVYLILAEGDGALLRREGANRGYQISGELFPDMEAPLSRLHDRRIDVLFNDHPEPRGLRPLAPELLAYREENLTRLDRLGLDDSWFDRNWDNIISGPVASAPTGHRSPARSETRFGPGTSSAPASGIAAEYIRIRHANRQGAGAHRAGGTQVVPHP